jgi:quinol monooxygenase YgiN
VTYVVTYIDVQPDRTRHAIVLLNQYREASSAEEGSPNITVFQETGRPSHFVILEAWDDSRFQLHESAGHTTRFRSQLRDIHNSPYDQRVHHAFAVGPQPLTPVTGTGVFVVVTHVDVPPPRKDETEVLLQKLVKESRNDAGNVRYDVFRQNAPRTNHFTVFAAWSDASAFASNQAAPHTRQFRENLGPMLGAPYDERLYNVID